MMRSVSYKLQIYRAIEPQPSKEIFVKDTAPRTAQLQAQLQSNGIEIEPVIEVARAAGELVLQMQRDGLHRIRDKSSTIDLVTEADVASERLIQSRLGELHPAIDFWGEESGRAVESELFWIVDPIDGTTNFANGVPFFAISIGLCRQASDGRLESLLGVVMELPVGRMYWALAGQGAFVRHPDGSQERLRVNGNTELERSLLSTGFPYHRAESADHNIREYAHFLPHCQGVRAMGSAALDLAYVARGVLAGYWEGWLGAWDAAAGVLLVSEAGGRVTDYTGAEWGRLDRGLIASNGQPGIHDTLVDGIQHARSTLSETRLNL